jgi:hypothetical protein
VPVVLASAAGAGGYAGPAWFRAVIEAAAKDYPGARYEAVLDCGEEAGTVLAALRTGFQRVRFTGSGPALDRLAAIAGQYGATIETATAAGALDLAGVAEAEAACRAFLGRNVGGR